MKWFAPIFICFLFSSFLGISQELDGEILGVLIPPEREEIRNRLLLSKSRQNYPVTPGDVYDLTYRSAGTESSNEILVESDYVINLGVFGTVTAANMTFPELKARVEEIISTAYPNSVPFLEIKSIGLFQVFITGEVPQTEFVTVWGMSRLSEVVEGKLAGYSSNRRIGINSKEGNLKEFDLFKARHQGVVEEDPFVFPGDTIIVYRREREIEIKGEVFRPGTYQILRYEGLEETIESYAGGLTQLSDNSRIRIDRLVGDHPQLLLIDLAKDHIKIVGLEDGDTIIVPSKTGNLPIVSFEGAVIPAVAQPLAATEESGAEAQGGYARIIHPFKVGETLYDALLSIRESISPLADLKGAYLIREEDTEPIPLNLEKLIYTYLPAHDIGLQPYDKIIIPYHRFLVTVVGAVDNPGNFQYSPTKKPEYYIGLAGGIPPGINSDDITIYDKGGNRRDPNQAIQPEDMIIVAQSFVSVTGAVICPGRYDFTPGKTYIYYVDMAGGIDTERNSNGMVNITDSIGNPRETDEIIQSGSRILVQPNDFIYNFNRYFPVVTTGIAFITTIITIINLLAE